MQTFEQTLRDLLDPEQISELAQYGADAGWPGLTYYTDTVRLHDEHESEIWDALHEDAQDFGHTIPELIAGFGGSKNVGSMEQLKNLLTWYMAERTAARIADR